MAPEQIEGAEADTRTDIFAFGVVLYEMLTGQKAFEGKSHASLMAAILETSHRRVTTRQPNGASTRGRPSSESAWPRSRTIAGRALPIWGARLQWASDSVNAGGAPASEPAVDWPHGHGTRRRVLDRRRSWRRWRWCSPIAAAGWRYTIGTDTGGERSVSRCSRRTDAIFAPAPVARPPTGVVSPDGRRLALVAAPRHGASRIWIRSLEGVLAQPLADTEGAVFPFWSPDGRWIAFFAGGKLKRDRPRLAGCRSRLPMQSNGRGGHVGSRRNDRASRAARTDALVRASRLLAVR